MSPNLSRSPATPSRGPLGTLGRLHLCRHQSNTKQTKRQKQQKAHISAAYTGAAGLSRTQQDSAGLSRTQEESAGLSRCCHDCAIELWWTKRNTCHAIAIKARQKLNIERMWNRLGIRGGRPRKDMRVSLRRRTGITNTFCTLHERGSKAVISRRIARWMPRREK